MPNEYGKDRAIVVGDHARLGMDGDHALPGSSSAAIRCFALQTSVAELGAEFFRWEFATAVAGAGIGVNPFDEPNVQGRKDADPGAARRAPRDRHLQTRSAVRSRRGLSAARVIARRSSPTPIPRPGATSRSSTIFPPRRADVTSSIASAPRSGAATGLATTYGIGPRYLHSTGQYHKGGPNTGLFLLLTAADASGTPIPGHRLHVRDAQARAGARRFRGTRRRRSRRRPLPRRRSGRRLLRDVRAGPAGAQIRTGNGGCLRKAPPSPRHLPDARASRLPARDRGGRRRGAGRGAAARGPQPAVPPRRARHSREPRIATSGSSPSR